MSLPVLSDSLSVTNEYSCNALHFFGMLFHSWLVPSGFSFFSSINSITVLTRYSILHITTWLFLVSSPVLRQLKDYLGRAKEHRSELEIVTESLPEQNRQGWQTSAANLLAYSWWIRLNLQLYQLKGNNSAYGSDLNVKEIKCCCACKDTGCLWILVILGIPESLICVITRDQSNLPTGCIAAAHGRFSGIR